MTDHNVPQEIFQFWQKAMEQSKETWSKLLNQPRTPDLSQFWKPFFDQGMEAWSRIFSQGTTPDAMAQWKQFLDQGIEAWSKVLAQVMGTEGFAQAMGKYLDQYLTAQGVVKRTSEQASELWLKNLGLPSRSQVVEVAKRLNDLEERLETMEGKIDRVTRELQDHEAAAQQRAAQRAT